MSGNLESTQSVTVIEKHDGEVLYFLAMSVILTIFTKDKTAQKIPHTIIHKFNTHGQLAEGQNCNLEMKQTSNLIIIVWLGYLHTTTATHIGQRGCIE